MECVLGQASRANWRYARSNSDIIMFDNDVTTYVALFLTNIPHLKDKDKDKEALFNVAYNVTDNISS